MREADGLAMSSRNQYLEAAQRAAAPEIHRTLLAMREATRAGVSPAQAEVDAAARLQGHGFAVDYAALRREDLEPVGDAPSGRLVALIAARIGNTRLIDNLAFDAG